MSIEMAWALVVLGLAVLAGGGELLVRGATATARVLGMRPAVIGLTVVAFGTSLPELVVSVLAAVSGEPAIAVGNVVGSNLANLTLIAGLTALVTALPIDGEVVRRQWPALFACTVLFVALVYDGALTRPEAVLLAAALVVFVAWTVRVALRDATAEERHELREGVMRRSRPWSAKEGGKALAAVLVGIALLVVGGRWLVEGAVEVAHHAGISERIVGLTIVAVGTSAPEIATSIVAALRGHTDVAIANLIGSNVFNTLGILGVAGLAQPLPFPPAVLQGDVVWMSAATLALFPLMRHGMRISRGDGLVLLGFYGVWLWWTLC